MGKMYQLQSKEANYSYLSAKLDWDHQQSSSQQKVACGCQIKSLWRRDRTEQVE